MYVEKKRKIILDWYSQYSASIFKFNMMMLRDSYKAEDLTQETFIKAFQYQNELDNIANPKTWLFKITRNLAIDYIRKQRFLTLLTTEKNLSCSVMLPQEIVEVKERSYELYRALSNLKGTYREVIILRKIKDFSIHETSEILGWSESKVKSTLFRALKVLEIELVKGGISYEELS